MRVHKKTVVLQNGLHGVQLKGAAQIVTEPDDFDETYLARRAVQQESLPGWLRNTRGMTVTLFRINSFREYGELTAPDTVVLGNIAAYGWLDAPADLPADDKRRAHTVFAKGSQYLAADLLTDFELYMWATFEPASALRVWDVKPASKKLEATALTELRKLPSYHARQAEYRTFLQRLTTAYAKVDKLRAEDAATRKRLAGFPSPSLSPSFSVKKFTGLWTVSGDSAPGLLVGYHRGWSGYRVPTTGVPGEGEDIEFDGALLVVWALDENRDRIEAVLGDLAPQQATGREMWDFMLRAGISRPGEPPALLFTAPSVNGVLTPAADGRYTVDRRLMLRPAELRRSALP